MSGGLGGDATALGDLLEGVQQDRFTLGDPRASLTLVEYGDLQCPFCADAATATIPGLVSEYVASGELRITFNPVSFIGGDSVEAVEMAAAAALQERALVSSSSSTSSRASRARATSTRPSCARLPGRWRASTSSRRSPTATRRRSSGCWRPLRRAPGATVWKAPRPS